MKKKSFFWIIILGLVLVINVASVKKAKSDKVVEPIWDCSLQSGGMVLCSPGGNESCLHCLR